MNYCVAFGCITQRGEKQQKEIIMETRKRHPENFSFCAGISISKYDTVLINVSLFSVMVSICCKEKLIGSLVLTMLTFQYVNNT